MHDADLNPRKKETPQSRRLCGEEEQPRSGRLFRTAEQAKRAARCDESPIIRTKKAPEGLLFYLQNPDILINRRSAHSKDSCRFADVELLVFESRIMLIENSAHKKVKILAFSDPV